MSAKIVLIETKAKLYQDGKKAELFHCRQSLVNYINKNQIKVSNADVLEEFFRNQINVEPTNKSQFNFRVLSKEEIENSRCKAYNYLI